jgi:ADP-heptose:LPS heptosyltransferase
LIPADLLVKPGKILFIAPFPIGDNLYLRNFFQALAAAYPQLEIHIWIDELRRTRDPAKWNLLKKYSLYDWLAACPFFKKIYNQTYSPALHEQSVIEARAHNYDIFVSLVTARPHKHARLARRICPDGFTAGIAKPLTLLTFHHAPAYKKLDAPILPGESIKNGVKHATEVYADWFEQLFGLRVPLPARYPRLDIPAKWKTWAANYLCTWRVDTPAGPLVFVNATASNKKRCWPITNAIKMIETMQQDPRWKDAWFLLNAMPSDFAATEAAMTAAHLTRVRPFSADDNFFQLPAMLAECDLIISVETAVMHLANAVRVPVIALMRQKNPEWKPIDAENSTVVMAPKPKDWIDKIPVDEVVKVISNTWKTQAEH